MQRSVDVETRTPGGPNCQFAREGWPGVRIGTLATGPGSIYAAAMDYIRTTFRNVGLIRLDGCRFLDCSFEDCTLVYAGTAAVSLQGCRFGPGVRWTVDGPAAFTAAFLRALWQGGGRAIVEGMLNEPLDGPTAAN